MNNEVVKAASIFFHCHNTFLYFYRVLPNLVFVNPQVPLDIAVVQFSYQVGAGEFHGFPARFASSLRDGIITEEILSHEKLSSCFIPGLYEPRDAIKLFCHTFTIAPLMQPQSTYGQSELTTTNASVSKQEYLMMCLLPALSEPKIIISLKLLSHLL